MFPASALTPEQLATSFESLGDNCEFGLIQRCCGAEPLGLFRFAGAALDNVIDVIATEGARLFDEEDLDLYYSEPLLEYFYTSRSYNDFFSHTYIKARASDESSFRSKRLESLSFLKRRFFETLRGGEKIFVRKGAEGIADIRRLWVEINKYGANDLLWVIEADRDHRPGTVEKLDERLWRGYVSRYKRFTKDEPFDLSAWVNVLRLTHARCRSGRLQPPRKLDGGRTRAFDPTIATEVTKGAENALLLALRRDTGAGDTILSVPLSPPSVSQAPITLSLAIKLDPDFKGELVDLVVPDGLTLHRLRADPTRSGVWQQLFITVRSTRKQPLHSFALRVHGRGGSRIAVGAWCAETGPIPKELGPDDRTMLLADVFTRARRQSRELVRRFWPAKTRDVLRASNDAMADGRFVEADDMLSLAIARSPNDAAAMIKQFAFSAHNSGRYIAALVRWQKALSTDPQDPICHAGVAANFREIGELQSAANVIADALARFPDDGTVLTEAARIASARGQHEQAVTLLDRTIALFGPIPDVLTARAAARSLAGD